ncbi:ThiF family adenylyltransferase [Hydrotalea sp.]|uniref:ThiF family adenylyltransferase n=1 Tax=Hydrotalea sp. TaxID=2881279 RepID=UPI0026074EC9|nr:ThiF family adenylyltransferase [Hydrotalea sp.]
MAEQERYSRQMMLPGFGHAAQQKLEQAKVLIVGMGALGCPALQYLTGAGIGTIGIADGDVIQLHNLHRQPLFYTGEVGQNKTTIAATKMRALNSNVQITVYPFHIDQKNALKIISEYDMVIDATDNFPSKYLLNDACALMSTPLIYGAVTQYEGQVAVFNHSKNGRNIQYRDVFPDPPNSGAILSCEEAGVLGVLPGIIGTVQAAEAMKLITGLGRLLDGILLTYQVLNAQCYEIELSKNFSVKEIDKATFENTDYQWICSPNTHIREISIDEFKQLQLSHQLFIIDVRECHEEPVVDFADVRIPLSQLSSIPIEIPDQKNICVICQHGLRSQYAAKQLQQLTHQTIFSLSGGLAAYFKV